MVVEGGTQFDARRGSFLIGGGEPGFDFYFISPDNSKGASFTLELSNPIPADVTIGGNGFPLLVPTETTGDTGNITFRRFEGSWFSDYAPATITMSLRNGSACKL